MNGADVRPGLYIGTLHHRRVQETTHAFTYPLFMVLLDVDEISDMMSVSAFTSYNRLNWAAFYERDHFGSPDEPLRQRLRTDAARHGFALPDGRIYLLTHLRYIGHCFNPVSFYYCYDREHTLRLVLAEVNNTFGGTHNYWLEPRAVGERKQAFRAQARKSFYVSPFMRAELEYAFVLSAPAARLCVNIGASEASTRSHVFDATLRMTRRPWNSKEIRRALCAYPAMTMSVVMGIHLQAVRLWWKGLRVVPRPTPDGVVPAVSTMAPANGTETCSSP